MGAYQNIYKEDLHFKIEYYTGSFLEKQIIKRRKSIICHNYYVIEIGLSFGFVLQAKMYSALNICV